MDFSIIIGLIILGLFVGIIISLIGVSGSVFVVPILMFVYSSSIYTAIGTSLFVDMIKFVRQKSILKTEKKEVIFVFGDLSLVQS